MTDEKAVSTPISLYPTQRAIADAFAAETGRNLSNAVQYIIEDWARLTGFQEKMQAEKRPAQARGKRSKKIEPAKVPGVRKGMALPEAVA